MQELQVGLTKEVEELLRLSEEGSIDGQPMPVDLNVAAEVHLRSARTFSQSSSLSEKGT